MTIVCTGKHSMNERKLYRKIIAQIERFFLSFLMKRKGGTDNTIDTVDFKEATGKQMAVPHTNMYLGSGLRNVIPVGFFILIILVFGGFVARFLQLQFTEGDAYRLRAERNRQRTVPIVAERGHVFDINEVQLTANIPTFSIALVPQHLPRTQEGRRELAERLASLTGEQAELILENITTYGSYSYESIIIQEDISYETALHILTQTSDLPGIYIHRASKREYLLNQPTDGTFTPYPTTTYSLSHVLGYLGKLNDRELERLRDQGYLTSDTLGKTGIEQYYELYLRGVYGEQKLEVDAFGREQSVLSEKAPLPGNHVQLTLDLELQRIAEESLNRGLNALEQTRGSVVVVDVKTGAIRALVSIPAYDNNDFSGGISQEKYQSYIEDEAQPLFNRSIAGTYPSGSTIKPIVSGAALQEGVITSRTTVRSTGGVEVGAFFFPDWKAGGHGLTNIRSSLAWSVNTFYYYIAGGHQNVPRIDPLGIERLSYYLHAFGLGKRLGVDLPAEASGFIPSKDWKEEVKNESWYIGDTYNLSIGQGDLLVTPLQLTSMIASIANGGDLYKPYLLHRVHNPLDNTYIETEPSVIQIQPVEETYLNTVRLGMRDCVLYGSCRRLKTVPVTIAGKTGTAQWSSKKEPHAWFTSFAPYNDPEIAVTVLIEEGIGGSDSAIPVAEEIYRWWAANRM